MLEHRIDDIDSQSRQCDEDRQFHETPPPFARKRREMLLQNGSFPRRKLGSFLRMLPTVRG